MTGSGKFFDMAEEPLRPVEVIGRKEAIATMLDMATQHGHGAITRQSSVCL